MKLISLENKLGIGGIFVLAVIPVIFWILMLPLSERFFNGMAVLTSIGQLTGLAGMALFAVSLILSTRYKCLEKYFRGLNRVYINHHTVGGLAFILLLIHPVVLTVRFIPASIRFAAMFLIGVGDTSILFGVVSLALMMVLLVLTFYFRPKYHIWKFTHKFLGLAFFIAGLHVFFITSDVSRSAGLRFYILGLVGFALLGYFYRTIFPQLFVKKYNYNVVGVRPVGAGSVEIEMAPNGEAMTYVAGQFAFFEFLDPQIGREEHPFSLASSPKNKNIKIVVKALGDYTRNLKNLSVGSGVRIEGSFGRFNFWNFPKKEQIWIAGGIGITPFLGMARDFVAGNEYHIDLYYCAKTEDEMVAFDELKNISANIGNFRIIGFCQNKEGFLTADAVVNMSGDLCSKDILLCGPPPMMNALRKQLMAHGVSNKNIHSEEFEF